jgi:hypothetical protein
MTEEVSARYKRYRFPAEIIAHTLGSILDFR